jgi:two-component system OmpR family sensor kinase
MIELFLMFIFYHYSKVEENHIKTNLFLEMKNYSLSFEDARFDIDLLPMRDDTRLYELSEDDDSLYILVPFEDSKKDVIKIIYVKTDYLVLIKEIQQKLLIQFLLLSLISMFISFLAALYSLRPIRKSLALLEDFIKDIIHDLNTPITSILVNLKMIEGKSEELDSISHSTKNIAMLHQNLDSYLREVKNENEYFYLKDVIDSQVKFFAPLYDYLSWEVNVTNSILYVDKNAFTRIIYNLLSNACKYNTSRGTIKIITKENGIYIINDSYGIKHPSKIFDRFYKESDRGLGIGLHIVHKLCMELKITKKLEVKENIVYLFLDLNQVTSK